MASAQIEPVVFSAAGVTLVLDVAGPGLPRVHHWGADLGPLDPGMAADVVAAGLPELPQGTTDDPPLVTLLPAQLDGWSGRPGLSGHRDGRSCHPRLALTDAVQVSHGRSGGGELTAVCTDTEASVEVRTELRMEPQGGVRLRHTLRNTAVPGGQAPLVWTLEELLCLLPLPGQATELLDLSGRWCRERSPQRGPLRFGTTARENRRGRTGHDAATLMVAGTPGFGFRHGQVWAVHVAWSGNHLHLTQRLPEFPAVLGGGELLAPGEIRLGPGESYQTPWVHFLFSDRGLDGLSERVHGYLRARDGHPRSPRPVVLNTWEAVYFDHRLDRLVALAERAAEVGVERFVLDDGWFRHRRDDGAGLGDWYVDPDVWPDGLHPLVDRVRELGMQFGLWVEPEMVNPDSDLLRAHPDWVLAAPGRMPRPARRQQVLDVARPEAYRYLLDRLDALVGEYHIDYLKWDHNRDLLEAVHDGQAGVHAQTLGTYRLLAELRARYPHLEIESCSSGGGRVDLGILEHTDRVWASDTNDPIERQQIQRWTALLVPPELIGAHVGPPTAHTSGRTTGLGFRCATALFGHAGIEWDITAASRQETEELAGWIRAYRRLRSLLHSGTTVRVDHPDPAALVHGLVAPDRSAAVFAYVQLTTSEWAIPPAIRFAGLAPDARYRVTLCPELAPPDWAAIRPPVWLRPPGVTLSGRALAEHGLACPPLHPADAVVLELRRVDAAD